MFKKIVIFGMWAQVHWLALVIFLTLAWGSMLFLVVLSWLYGYWSNGLWNTKFEINSCWQGVGAILAGFASIAALAKAGWTKWKTDSEDNTLKGEMPSMDMFKGGVKL